MSRGIFWSVPSQKGFLHPCWGLLLSPLSPQESPPLCCPGLQVLAVTLLLPCSILWLFFPWFILSWSPGTAQIRASTWGWHFCLKEMQYIKKEQTYERECFLRGAAGLEILGCVQGACGLGLDLTCHLPNWEQRCKQQLQERVKTEQGTRADRRTPISLLAGSQGTGYRSSCSPTKQAGFLVS